MSKVRLLRLKTDRTADREWADVEETRIKGRKSGHTVLIDGPSVFDKEKPHRFNTLVELLSARTPPPSEDSKERQVLAADGDIWSVRYDESGLESDAHAEADAHTETNWQNHMNTSGQRAAMEAKRAQAFSLIAGAAAVMGIIFSIVVLAVMFL